MPGRYHSVMSVGKRDARLNSAQTTAWKTKRFPSPLPQSKTRAGDMIARVWIRPTIAAAGILQRVERSSVKASAATPRRRVGVRSPSEERVSSVVVAGVEGSSRGGGRRWRRRSVDLSLAPSIERTQPPPEIEETNSREMDNLTVSSPEDQPSLQYQEVVTPLQSCRFFSSGDDNITTGTVTSGVLPPVFPRSREYNGRCC
jgi:hypothetical protein